MRPKNSNKMRAHRGVAAKRFDQAAHTADVAAPDDGQMRRSFIQTVKRKDAERLERKPPRPH